eukprot:39007_1
MTRSSTTFQYNLSTALIIFIYLSLIVTARVSFKYFKYNHSRSIFFRSRNVTFNSIYLSTCLFTLYILIPFILVTSHLAPFHSLTPIIMTEVVDLCIFFPFYMRTWVLWFDRIFVEHLQNWMWRREVNHQDTNILIQQRQMLKSSILVMFALYLFVFVPIYATLQILPYILPNASNLYVIRTILLLVLWLSTYALLHNISPVFDTFHVRSEALQSLKTVGTVHLISHVSYLIVLHSMGDIIIAMLIKLFLFSISNLCILYSCYCCIKEHEFRNKYEKALAIRDAATKLSFVSLTSTPLHFQQIMNSKHGFLALCNHLQKEISLETILFLLEVTQFKAVIYAALKGNIENNVLTLCDPLSASPRNAYGHHVADIAPTIFNAETVLHVPWLPVDPRMHSSKPFVIALYIYDKYIEESADLCINISYECRKDIYRFFQELHVSQQKHDDVRCLYELFDNAFRETWHLIATDSYFRFRTTDEFMLLYTFMHPSEAKQTQQDLTKMVNRTLARERELNPIENGKIERIDQATPESRTNASTTASSSFKLMFKSKLTSIMDNFTEIPSESIDSIAGGSKKATTIGIMHSVDFTDLAKSDDIKCNTGSTTRESIEDGGNPPPLQYRLKQRESSKRHAPLRRSISAPHLRTTEFLSSSKQSEENRAKTTDDLVMGNV